MGFKIKEDDETLVITGTLVRLAFGKLPTFGKKTKDEGEYYQISIRVGAPSTEIREAVECLAYPETDRAFIPKWVKGEEKPDNEGFIFVNLKSRYEVALTVDGENRISWDDFREEYGNGIGSEVKVSAKMKPGALYPQGVYFFDEIKQVSVKDMF